MNENRTTRRPGIGWWIRQLVLTGLAGCFVWFGIAVLVGAYGLGDPFSFIMSFFAASLIILISLVMAMAFVLRMWRERHDDPNRNDPQRNP